MEQFLLCGLTLQGSCDLQLERPLPLKKTLSQGWGSWKQEREVVVYLKMEQKMVISLNGFGKNEFSVSRSLNHYLVCTEN